MVPRIVYMLLNYRKWGGFPHYFYMLGISFIIWVSSCCCFLKHSAILWHIFINSGLLYDLCFFFETYTHHISFFPSGFCTFSLCVIIILYHSMLLFIFFNFKFLVFIFDNTSLVMWLWMLFFNSFQSVCSFCKLNEFYFPSACL